MYQLEQTVKFKKDIKLAKKRGLDMRLLDEVVTQLVEKGTLPQKTKPTNWRVIIKGFGNAISNQIGCWFGHRTTLYGLSP